MDSSKKPISTPEIDPKRLELFGAIKNDYDPLSDREFVTKKNCEVIADLFEKTTYNRIIKHWDLS